MRYPENIELKLGFDKIKALVAKHCSSTLGVAFVDRMKFSGNMAHIKQLVSQTSEFKDILESDERFPQANYIDVNASLDKARVEGVFLLENELHDISISLDTILKCLTFFSKFQHQYPNLFAITGGVLAERALCKEIDDKIDEKGLLRNNATPALARIRQSIQSEQGRIRKQLNQELRNAIKLGYVQEDGNVTIRGGRMVIPVLAEHKRKIKGFIHDESSSGQLVYMEPAAVLEANNTIRELEYQEKREIMRILTDLTDLIRPHLDELAKAYRFLGMVDFIRAKARFAMEIQAIMPAISKEKSVDWRLARHPLLLLAHQKLGKDVVPLSIYLDKTQRILVISGPNAGGKSVCLKTVGLLQYMFQCGLLIPVEEGSKVCVFKNLFIDIGDEQSIENDLSTYSSHLTNMKFFLKHGDKDTLFLIDEFGTGTDPNFGGAIAEAILDKMHKNEAFGMVNTHYGNLKQYADNTEGIVNGAMRFDVQNLEPLYKLEIGKPGSSFALEIAYKIGLPHQLIDQVKNNLGIEKVNFDKLLARLEKDKQYYDSKKDELKRKNKELNSLLEKYNRLSQDLDQQKKTILNQAKEEARQILAGTNQKIEATIKSIKENKAEKTATKVARQSLDTFKKSLSKQKVKKVRQEVEVIGGEIEVGAYVRVKGQATLGEVLAVKGKDVEIRIGALTSKVKRNRLERVSKKAFREVDKMHESTSSASGFDISKRNIEFKSQIDLRGKRKEEALMAVDNLIDDAMMLGMKELRVIHGKGDGILREMIRNHLRTYSQVSNIRDEHADRGGAGITIFELG